MTVAERNTPSCICGHVLDRIDHYSIEHLILDNDVYRPVNVGDFDVEGNYGLASETDLRCGYCGTSVPRESREFFYRRWYQIPENIRSEA